jgi:hypothetical protein
MEVNVMSQNNNFESVDNALEMFGKIVSENDDFDTQMEEMHKLTESLIANIPKVSSDILNEYQGYISTVLSMRDKYKDHYDEQEQQTLKQTVRNEYASGGESLHRGYYCPSPTLDKLVGGLNRGRRLQKPRSNSHYYYKYYFDDNNRIIRCDNFIDDKCCVTEFIIFEDNKTYGITFNIEDNSTSLLSMEQYSDRGTLDKYITILPDLYTGRENHSIYSSEKYEYDENNILRKLIYATGIPKMNLLTEEKYTVVYDNNDIIVGFDKH